MQPWFALRIQFFGEIIAIILNIVEIGATVATGDCWYGKKGGMSLTKDPTKVGAHM